MIRAETPADAAAIARLTTAAFAGAPHASGTEAAIVERLRAAGALTLSLVADEGAVVGHVAFSPITIDGRDEGWFGLGPVSVAPARQRRGLGSALVRAGLDELRRRRAGGCVVLGDPRFYGRFGFARSGLVLPGVPVEYFIALGIAAPPPCGVVAYHPAFAADTPPQNENPRGGAAGVS